MIKLQKNQNGVVSFFTVMFVSILLIIMTTAFIRLMINEQQQSTNNDLSSRAFYAAESGVTDAIVELRDKLQEGQLGDIDLNTCGAEVQLGDSGDDISYTCKFIGLEVNQLEGVLGEGDTLTLDLVDASAVNSLEVSWHSSEDDLPVFGTLNSLTAGQNLSQTTWKNQNIPAIMRLHSITFDDSTTSPLRDRISNDITFGYPVGGENSTAPSSPVSLNIGTAKGPGIANCNGGSTVNGYACQLSFDGLGNDDNKFLRLQAINNSTHYKIRTLNSSDQEVAISEHVAVIDVTGKAGPDVFRRVRVFVPIVSNDLDLLPNQALLVDEGICKDFEVIGDEATDNLGCESD